MERAASLSDGGIDDVLFLTRDSGRIPIIEDSWLEHGSSLSLQVSPIDSFAHRCHEAAFHRTENSHMRSSTRNRLMEVTVERLDGADNPLAVDELPSRGLCDRTDEMLTLMEFADLHDAVSIADRLEKEDLDRQGRIISELQSSFTSVRDDHAATREGPRLSIRGERYSQLVNDVDSLADVVDGPEVVIMSGYTLLSPLEREFLAKVVEAWPTIAILPTTGDAGLDTGVDAAVERVYDAFTGMDLEPEHHDPDEPAGDATRELTYQLFREPSTGTEEVVEGVERYEAPTRPMELRHVASSVLADIETGYAPGDIGVVLTLADVYGTLVDSIFDQYEVPYTSSVDVGLLETEVGGAIGDVLRVTEESARTAPLVTLLANPLVEPWADRESASVLGDVRDIDRRLDSTALSRVRMELATEIHEAIDDLLERIGCIRSVDLGNLDSAIERLLDTLGIEDRLGDLEGGARRGYVERDARDQLVRTAKDVASTASIIDGASREAADRLERALQSMVVERSLARETDRVVVTDLSGVGVDAFERVYLVGQSAGDFPSNPDRLAFTRPINEAHDDFAPADTQLRARYHAAILLNSADEATLTMAERNLDGQPLVESDLLTELRRVANLGASPIDTPLGSQEDIQRAIAAANGVATDGHPFIDAATDAGTFTDRTAARAHAGSELAAARSAPESTAYDGQLSAEVRRALHDRSSYAPTPLETYAACGFKYYMGRVLDIDEPEPISAEPDGRARGGFLHDVLERSYLDELQTEIGGPVTVDIDDSSEWQERLLTIAIDELDTDLTEDPTAFQLGWLEGIFAGLGTPDDNPYHGDQRSAAEERGLLRRFLDEEATMQQLSVDPTWFEARFGPERPWDRTMLRETPVEVPTPHGTVEVTGTVDRIDIVQADGTTELVVRDYKTGKQVPSEGDTLDGLGMQLPIYTLMAEDELGNRHDGEIETVGGAYYHLRSHTASHNKGQIGSEERTAHALSGGGQPLSAWQYPRFETHDEFRTFIEEEVPRRLGRIATGIESGVYNPTILASDDAGCRYCDFSHVCDVRHHHRHATMEALDESDRPAYIPPVARDEEYGLTGGDS